VNRPGATGLAPTGLVSRAAAALLAISLLAAGGSRPALASVAHRLPVQFTGKPRHFGDYYGLGTYIAQRYPKLAKPALSRVRSTGVNWVREEFTASDLHHHPHGPYHFKAYDRVIHREIRGGLHVLGLLDYNNTWLAGHDHTWMGHHDMANLINNFVKYVKAVVSHYRGKIFFWQVWNEPDLRQFWEPHPEASDYAHLLAAANKAIKHIDRRDRVLMAGPSGRDAHPFRYIRRVILNGGKFDIITIQPYATLPDAQLFSTVSRLKRWHKPVWFTEMGWAGQVGCGPCGRSGFQARRLATLYFISGLAGVDRVFWYDFRDDGVRPIFPDHFGLVEWNMAAKQAYVAYEVSLYFLNQSNLMGVDRLTSQLTLYEFQRHHRTFYVAWNDGPAWSVVNLVWKLHAVRALDTFGQQTSVSGKGILHLGLPPDAVQYIAGPHFAPPLSMPPGLPIPPGHTK